MFLVAQSGDLTTLPSMLLICISITEETTGDSVAIRSANVIAISDRQPLPVATASDKWNTGKLLPVCVHVKTTSGSLERRSIDETTSGFHYLR